MKHDNEKCNDTCRHYPALADHLEPFYYYCSDIDGQSAVNLERTHDANSIFLCAWISENREVPQSVCACRHRAFNELLLLNGLQWLKLPNYPGWIPVTHRSRVFQRRLNLSCFDRQNRLWNDYWNVVMQTKSDSTIYRSINPGTSPDVLLPSRILVLQYEIGENEQIGKKTPEKSWFFCKNSILWIFPSSRIWRETSSLQRTIPCFFTELLDILVKSATSSRPTKSRRRLPITQLGLDQIENPAYKRPAGIWGNGIFIRCARYGVVGRL